MTGGRSVPCRSFTKVHTVSELTLWVSRKPQRKDWVPRVRHSLVCGRLASGKWVKGEQGVEELGRVPVRFRLSIPISPSSSSA